MTSEPLRTLLARNPSPMTLDGTRSFIVGHRRVAVIDPGPAHSAHIAELLRALEPAHSVIILLTHAHPDHSGAALPLASRTGAPIWMAAGALRSPVPAASVRRWIVAGDELETDAGTIRVIATPGHTPEHVSFLWSGPQSPDGGALFAGDLFMGEGDTTLVAPPEGNLAHYLASLDRIEELAVGVIYPAHGPPLDDPRGALDRYRRHRLERIRQVEEALASAPQAGLDELVTLVYGSELDPRLRPAARGSIDAMARYLRAVD